MSIKTPELPQSFSGSLPPGCNRPEVFLPGTLVVEGTGYHQSPHLADQLAISESLSQWPVILLVDSTLKATCSMQEFLWTFFTRFEPAADIHSSATSIKRFHVGLISPVVFDCRMKPWYTDILEVDTATKSKVDTKFDTMIPARWR
jgi:4-hydroxybenzoate decarboxylase subunit C